MSTLVGFPIVYIGTFGTYRDIKCSDVHKLKYCYFTATKLGAVAAHHLPIPLTREETMDLLAQTQEVFKLETLLLQVLSFDGIEDIGDLLERAELGGILSGYELLAVATTLQMIMPLLMLFIFHLQSKTFIKWSA